MLDAAAGERAVCPDARALSEALDAYHDGLLGRHVHDTLRQLLRTLSLWLSAAPSGCWPGLVTRCRGHAVSHLLYQEPTTWRAFVKPRGYPGDAVTIDLLYGHPSAHPIVEAASDLGQGIYSYVRHTVAANAVRQRRQFMAARIDDAAKARKAASILSLGCGHLRELEVSEQFRCGRVARFVALDQDAQTLAVVRHEHSAVIGIQSTVK